MRERSGNICAEIFMHFALRRKISTHMNLKFMLLPCLLVAILHAQPADDSFRNLANNFEKEYTQLNIPDLGLSYVSNLQNIGTAEELEKQKSFFKKYQKLIEKVAIHDLSEQDKLAHAVLSYEIDLNLQRIDLEQEWSAGSHPIKGTRVYDEQLGKQWYAYFLKKWIDKSLTPDVAYQFGLKEIEQVKKEMKAIQKQMGLNDEGLKKELEDSRYFLTNNHEVLKKYNALKQKIRQNTKPYFPDVDDVPPVEIEAGTNEAMAIAPAYYNNNTFYYNFFGDTYDSREMGWIFLHEAIPGHHYQTNLDAQVDAPILQLFWYMSYVEGWGAYIEQFGNELGVYKSPMDAYAQLEWDLIRSVRVALDVALNYYGWTDEQAMAFWKQHITDKDDIAKREIKRMKRWPAQVITYKYGKHILDELKGGKKSPAALKDFHRQVLKYGDMPLSVLYNQIQEQSSGIIPSFGFGNSMEETKRRIRTLSDSMVVRTNEPIQLPTAKNNQSQIDVYGFEYKGKKRKLELIFADDRLDIAWILTEAEEEGAFIQQFKAMYGEPTHITEDATFFINDGVAVRNKPHEILFISERLIAPYKQFLQNQ